MYNVFDRMARDQCSIIQISVFLVVVKELVLPYRCMKLEYSQRKMKENVSKS